MQHHKRSLREYKIHVTFLFIQEETIISIIFIIYLLPKPPRQQKNILQKNIGTVPDHQGFGAGLFWGGSGSGNLFLEPAPAPAPEDIDYWHIF